MSSAALYRRQHDCIRRFLDECVDVCGGDSRLAQGMVGMALVSCASQVFKGNAEATAMYCEKIGEELAERIRSGDFELGRDPH